VERNAHPIKINMLRVLAPRECLRRELTSPNRNIFGIHPFAGAAEIR
jgi:hypothetical protein